MDRLYINTKQIVSIITYKSTKDNFWKYHPKYDKKITWKERIFGECEMRKVNRKEGIVLYEGTSWWFSEKDFLTINRHKFIKNKEIWIDPKVCINLINQHAVEIYFPSYSDAIDFVEWLSLQYGYVDLKNNNKTKNCTIYFN